MFEEMTKKMFKEMFNEKDVQRNDDGRRDKFKLGSPTGQKNTLNRRGPHQSP